MRHLVLLLAACNSSSKPAKAPDLDATALHHILTTDESKRVEEIKISPDHGKAHYTVVWKDRSKHDEAIAEFPGTFTDEMVAAGVQYAVGARETDGHWISMTQLRATLQCGAHQPRCDDAAAITGVKIIKLDQRARYEVTRTGGVDIAYGEYPGHVVDELRAAGIAFTESP